MIPGNHRVEYSLERIKRLRAKLRQTARAGNPHRNWVDRLIRLQNLQVDYARKAMFAPKD